MRVRAGHRASRAVDGVIVKLDGNPKARDDRTARQRRIVYDHVRHA